MHIGVNTQPTSLLRGDGAFSSDASYSYCPMMIKLWEENDIRSTSRLATSRFSIVRISIHRVRKKGAKVKQTDIAYIRRYAYANYPVINVIGR